MEARVSYATSQAIISHGKELPLEFSISMFGKDSFTSEGIELFYYINAYWESLPENKQKEIYDLYKQFQDVMDTILDKDEQRKLIGEISSKLMKNHRIDSIKTWILANPTISFPSDIQEECVEDINRNVTHDRTIVKRDYLEIIAMSLAMRAMVPVWGTYIPTIKNEAGTSHKEKYAFELLRDTEYYFCRAATVITNYIEATVKDDKSNPNILNMGISSDDYARIMMCTTCVRKVSVGDISGRPSVPHIIKLIYKSIVSKLQNMDRDYETGIKNKDDESKASEKGNEENKLSVWERYRIIYDLDIGTVVELNHSANNIAVILDKLGLTPYPELVVSCVESARILISRPLEEPQLTILKWVIKEAVVPRGVPYIETVETVATLIGIVQAKLWVEGHKYLAILASCYSHVSEAGMVVSASASKDHISKDLKDEIAKIYPCREKTLDKRETGKEANLTLQSIDNLVNSLSRFVWRPTADPKMVAEVFGKELNRIPVRPTIKTDIANLVLDIGYRWNRPNK